MTMAEKGNNVGALRLLADASRDGVSMPEDSLNDVYAYILKLHGVKRP